MKKARVFVAAAMVAMATSASAQFTNSNSNSNGNSGTPEDWNTIWVEWNPSSIKPDHGDSQSFTGLSLGYSHAFGVSSSIPLFVEPGVGVQYSFHSEDVTEEEGFEDYTDIIEIKNKFSMFSVKVPVNLIYNWQIPNSSISLMPFVGINMRYNLSGKQKYDWSLDSDYDIEEVNEVLEEYYGDDLDLFDKKDMGKDDVWNRFQIGWHAGVKARFGKNLMVGFSYGTDFSEICEKAKIGTGTISVGYTF